MRDVTISHNFIHLLIVTQFIFCISPSMPMRCYGTSRAGLTTRRSARNSRNSVLKTRYVHISGKAERDGRQAHAPRRQTTQKVYRLHARGGGFLQVFRMLQEVVLSYPLTLIQLPINSIIVTHKL